MIWGAHTYIWKHPYRESEAQKIRFWPKKLDSFWKWWKKKTFNFTVQRFGDVLDGIV